MTLIEAVRANDRAAVKAALAAEAVHAATVVEAVAHDDGALIRLVALEGVDLGPAVLAAAATGRSRALRSLLNAGGDPSSVDAEGNSALVHAVRSGAVDCLKVLLKAGASPQATAPDGEPLLVLCGREAAATRVEWWEANGSCGDVRVRYEVVRGTLTAEADGLAEPLALADERLVAGRHCPPHARWVALADVARALLRAGADPLAADAGGRSALHAWARAGHPDVVQLLLKAGARPSTAADGTTVASLAVASKVAEVVALLP